MLEHPYILEATYRARRQDELGTIELDGRRYRLGTIELDGRPYRLGTIELDGRRYRAVWSPRVRIGPLPRPSLRLDLRALLRRGAPVHQPAGTTS